MSPDAKQPSTYIESLAFKDESATFPSDLETLRCGLTGFHQDLGHHLRRDRSGQKGKGPPWGRYAWKCLSDTLDATDRLNISMSDALESVREYCAVSSRAYPLNISEDPQMSPERFRSKPIMSPSEYEKQVAALEEFEQHRKALRAASEALQRQKTEARDICKTFEDKLAMILAQSIDEYYYHSSGQSVRRAEGETLCEKHARLDYFNRKVRGSDDTWTVRWGDLATKAHASVEAWAQLNHLAANVGFYGTTKSGFSFPDVLTQLSSLRFHLAPNDPSSAEIATGRGDVSQLREHPGSRDCDGSSGISRRDVQGDRVGDM